MLKILNQIGKKRIGEEKEERFKEGQEQQKVNGKLLSGLERRVVIGRNSKTNYKSEEKMLGNK